MKTKEKRSHAKRKSHTQAGTRMEQPQSNLPCKLSEGKCLAEEEEQEEGEEGEEYDEGETNSILDTLGLS